MASDEPIERKKWLRRPNVGVPGTLYDFVRRYVHAQGGSCSRDILLYAILAKPALKARLENGQGFGALLSNMRHSGDIVVDGDLIRVTDRTIRRIREHPQRTR